ncbi:MAG: mechanosensitive ion channel [Gammaproteobacteria bacterium]|nr:mechanosensitive ion channel [Gammaproteobacteria bacterium]
MENTEMPGTSIDLLTQFISIDLLTQFGYRIIAAVLIFLIGRWVAKWLVNFARKWMAKSNLEDTLGHFLTNLLYGVLMTVIVIAAINQLGVQTTSLLAVVGAAGLAIGLALQGSLSNFAAGVMIVAFRPYRVGDYIEAGGVAGTVVEVQIFTTVLKSPDNKKIIVPNAQIMAGTIVNISANPTRRVDLVAGCGYNDDLDKVRQVLEAIVSADDRVLADPAPTIAVAELGDSSVNFVVRPWVNAADYWPTHFDMTEAIKRRFDEEGISIPYPQRDVHIYQHSAGT